MSRRHRPLGEYLRAAAKLADQANPNPHWEILKNKKNLTRGEKSAIARVAKLAPLVKRSNSDYSDIVERLHKFAPGLKKYRRRKKFSNAEKAFISHKEKQLRYTDNLIPVTKQTAIEFKDQLFPGSQAIQFRNTSPDAKFKRIGRDMLVTSNGRDFIYWRLQNKRTAGLKKAGKQVFENFQATFQLEQITKLAKKAFARKRKPRQIFLWAESGRVGEGFADFDAFMDWLMESYSQYKNVERWVNGIAIQLT